MGRLDGKIAIVTGGARGIGRAIVEKFALEGATVAVFDVLGDAGPRVDVTVDADVAAGVRRVEHEFGRVDVLVNNAGVNAYYDATAMTEAEWERVFAVDLKGAWLCAKHVLPGMAQRGRGAIVNIASIHASLTIAGMFPYAAAKSGLVGLSRSLALDYAPKGIRVNVVSPGWTRTHLVDEWFARQPDPAAAEVEHPARASDETHRDARGSCERRRVCRVGRGVGDDRGRAHRGLRPGRPVRDVETEARV